MSTKAEMEAELKQLRRVRDEYAEYKDLVRTVAIREARDNNWCDEGLNEVLEELSLDPKPSRYNRWATVRVMYSYDPDEIGLDEPSDGVIEGIKILDYYGRGSDYEVEEFEVTYEDPQPITD